MKKSNDGDGSKMVTLTSGLTTEIGLSEMDDMVGQGPSTSNFNVFLFGGISLGCDLPPREELFAREVFPARSKHYLSQSAKTLFKDFSGMNPPAV